ncbi:ankyrin repeat domain-containing protein [Sediminibacterium ginsengisoli]|uniref:Tetratricopeptide repeat protein n=1 Tax=Sediminibacterium ginsengisoli TaxID=413434 RepID=A0A1T4R4K0_9BACT|nr:ankyrin repeat domain-containing protein [Sediminibacterium ginsengisoli]SKA11004.1 hypothetical protein SAMN04488132_110132 [Sediminibacterium ginsengisoli]
MKSLSSFVLLFFFCSRFATAQSDKSLIDSAYRLVAAQKFSAADRIIQRSKGKKEKENAASYAAKAWLINEGRRYNWYRNMADNFAASYPPHNEPEIKPNDPRIEAGKKTWQAELLENASLALKYDEQNAMGYLMRGVYYSLTNDSIKALADFDMAEKLDPANCYVGFCRGNLYGNGNMEAAIAQYQKTIACAPSYPWTYHNIALILFQLKRYDEALAMTRKYAAIDQSSAGPRFLSLLYASLLQVNGPKSKYVTEALDHVRKRAAVSSDKRAYFEDNKMVVQTLFSYYSPATLQLLQACMSDQPDKALQAVEAGADVNVPFSAGFRAINYPILYAAKTRNLPLFETLLKKGVDVNAQDDLGFSALHYLGGPADTGAQNVLVMADLLQKQKPNLNIRNWRGESPLLYSFTYMNEDYIRLLISAGADVNLADQDGITPLSRYSGTDNSASLVKMLLNAGADPTLSSKTGRDIFSSALYYRPGSLAVLYLLEKSKPGLMPSCTETSFIRGSIIGKPGAVLMDAMIDNDLAAFKKALPTVKDPEVINYMSVAAINFSEGRSFYDELIKVSTGPLNFSLPNGLNGPGQQISPRKIFYEIPPTDPYADLQLYYREEAREMREWKLDVMRFTEIYTNHAQSPAARCNAIAMMVNASKKILDIALLIDRRHRSGEQRLSEASAAYVAKMVESKKEDLKKYEFAQMRSTCITRQY